MLRARDAHPSLACSPANTERHAVHSGTAQHSAAWRSGLPHSSDAVGVPARCPAPSAEHLSSVHMAATCHNTAVFAATAAGDGCVPGSLQLCQGIVPPRALPAPLLGHAGEPDALMSDEEFIAMLDQLFG